MKISEGIYLPDSGFIEVSGKKIGEGGNFAENIGALIEIPGFLNGYTGFQNLQFLAEIQHRIGKKEEGKLILLASHIKEDLEILCDEVYEIQNCSLHRISFEDKDKSTAYS